MFPVWSAPAGAASFFTIVSAGSASRFAGLHRRLFLSHASGVETLANDSNLIQSATPFNFLTNRRTGGQNVVKGKRLGTATVTSVESHFSHAKADGKFEIPVGAEARKIEKAAKTR